MRSENKIMRRTAQTSTEHSKHKFHQEEKTETLKLTLSFALQVQG